MRSLISMQQRGWRHSSADPTRGREGLTVRAVHPLQFLGDPSCSDVWFPSCPDDPSRPDHLASLSHLPINHLEHLHPFDVRSFLEQAWLTRLTGMLPFLASATISSPSQGETVLHTLVDVSIVREPCAFPGLCAADDGGPLQSTTDTVEPGPFSRMITSLQSTLLLMSFRHSVIWNAADELARGSQALSLLCSPAVQRRLKVTQIGAAHQDQSGPPIRKHTAVPLLGGWRTPFSIHHHARPESSAHIDGDVRPRVWLLDAPSLRLLLFVAFFTGSGSVSTAVRGYVMRVVPPPATVLLELGASARPAANCSLMRLAARSPTTSIVQCLPAVAVLLRISEQFLHSRAARCWVALCSALQAWHPSVRPCASKSDCFKCAFFVCPLPGGDFGRSSSSGSRSRSLRSLMGRRSASCLLPSRS